MSYLSIDIGGTYIKYALLDDKVNLTHHGKVHTPVNQNNAIVSEVKSIIIKYKEQFAVSGVGISTAGIVNREKGEIIYAGPTIQDYKGTNFKQLLADTNLPIHVENDVNSALLGERWKGAGRASENFFCVTLGTGIGGAYYHNGLVSGSHLQANSVGYLLYDPATGTTYEQRASTSALNARILERLGSNWSTREVFHQAKVGDDTCLDIIHAWGREVAAGLAQIILLKDPEMIIIGGGVSQQGDFLIEIIGDHVEEFLPESFMKTEIKVAELCNHAALYGAVYPFLKNKNIY